MGRPDLRRPTARVVIAGIALVAVVALGGPGGAGWFGTAERWEPVAGPHPAAVTPGSAPAPKPARPLGSTVSLVAEAAVGALEVYPSPGAGRPERTLAHPTDNGGPLVMLVRTQREGWIQVHLPVRPNGTSGWVRSSDVTLSQHDYRIDVELSAHRLTVYRGDDVVLAEPVGIGTTDTPTPGGVFYLKELLQPPDPNGLYGPYAYGLSGFSNQLTSFAGGDAVIGIHGTNDPSSLGRDVSSGCIRMSNEAITALAAILPLGTPVNIMG